MTHRFARLAVVSLTALSLAATLFVSVLAQSHAATNTTVGATEPCLEHQQPQATDFWDNACESVCETHDNPMALSANADRANSKDKVAALVVYAPQGDLRAAPQIILCTVHGHDPPGSTLYLTTQRLRL